MIDINDKDVIINVLKDSIQDGKDTKNHLTNIMYFSFAVIALLVGAIFTLNVFTQNKIERMAKEHTAQYQEFIKEFGFEESITQTFTSEESDTITDVNVIEK